MSNRIDENDNGLENESLYLSKSNRLRVYIACSLTNENNPKRRDYLLSEIGKIFNECGFDVYDPSQHTKPGSPHLDKEVAAIDHLQAMRCDLIFFVRDHPSIGMGIEAQIAADMLIPWGDAKAGGDLEKLCPLLAGLANAESSFLTIYNTEEIGAFIKQLRKRLQDQNLISVLKNVRHDKKVASELIRQSGIGRAIRRQRLLLNLSATELGKLVDLDDWWIKSIEINEELTDCLTFMQLVRLIDATRLRFVDNQLASGNLAFPRLEPIDYFGSKLIAAADEFTNYSLRQRLIGEPFSESDEEMLTHWRDWLSESKGLTLPQRQQPSAPTVSELSIFIANPLSHINEEERKAGSAVVKEVEEACKRLTGISIKVVLPDFQKNGRHDSGPKIYLDTLSRLQKCDFAVALLTPPATGVGIMARLFANATMPCMLIAKKETPVSRMILGLYICRIGDVIEYVSLDEVSAHVEDLLKEYLQSLCESAGRRREALKKITEAGKKSALDSLITQPFRDFEGANSLFSNVKFVRPEWLDGFAHDPFMLATVTLIQFVHIANKLNWRICVTPSGVPYFTQTSCPLNRPAEFIVAQGEGKQKYSSGLQCSELPFEQRLLPGMDDSNDASLPQELETDIDIFGAISFLLGVAKYGLPPCIISRALGMSRKDIDIVLAAKFKSGELLQKDGIWSTGLASQAPPPKNADQILHRALDALLIFLDCENATPFAERLQPNAKILAQSAKSIPADIQARMYLLHGKKLDVQKYVRESIRDIKDNKSKEYIEFLVLLGYSITTSEEARGYLDEAIEVCKNVIDKNDGEDSGWKELFARASVARYGLNTSKQNGDAEYQFSHTIDLLRSTGNTLAASAVEFKILESKERKLAKHFDRSKSESPLVRVRAAQIYKAAPNVEGILSEREEVTDKAWNNCIVTAKAEEPWNE